MTRVLDSITPIIGWRLWNLGYVGGQWLLGSVGAWGTAAAATRDRSGESRTGRTITGIHVVRLGVPASLSGPPAIQLLAALRRAKTLTFSAHGRRTATTGG
jgi:hypothetical protein